MTYKKFEEIEVWQKTRAFLNEIYNLIHQNKQLYQDKVLTNQLKRATYSILLNISEGFERGGYREFANFLNIAKGSAGEVRTILYIMIDQKYIDTKTHDTLKEQIENISIQLASFRTYLLKSRVNK